MSDETRLTPVALITIPSAEIQQDIKDTQREIDEGLQAAERQEFIEYLTRLLAFRGEERDDY